MAFCAGQVTACDGLVYRFQAKDWEESLKLSPEQVVEENRRLKALMEKEIAQQEAVSVLPKNILERHVQQTIPVDCLIRVQQHISIRHPSAKAIDATTSQNHFSDSNFCDVSICYRS